MSRRMRNLDTAVDTPKSFEAVDRESPEIPADDSQLPTQHTRADYLAGDVDTEAEAARDALQQARDEQQLKMDEKINPRWIDSQAGGPAFLLVVAFLMWSEAARYGAPDAAYDEILIVPFILAGIAVVWFAIVLIIDRFR